MVYFVIYIISSVFCYWQMRMYYIKSGNPPTLIDISFMFLPIGNIIIGLTLFVENYKKELDIKLNIPWDKIKRKFFMLK